MIRTNTRSNLNAVGIQSCGKLSYSYGSLLPVLALCLATAAMSQTSVSIRGRGVPATVQLAKPAAATPATGQYSFTTIKFPGSAGAYAFNINDGRLVTGEYLDASANWHGFVWQNGDVHTLDNPGSLDTELSATNNQGVVTGLYGDFTTGHAATYSLRSGTWTTLPDISGMPINYGNGINNLGVVVGVAGVGNLDTITYDCGLAWIWNLSKYAYSFFSVPGGMNTCAYGINDTRQVVGAFNDASGVLHGFLKDGASYTTFDVPGAAGTGSSWINNSGVIVGASYDASGAHGYVRGADGSFTIVDVPGASGTGVYGINDHGDLCGYYSDASGVSHAYVALKR